MKNIKQYLLLLLALTSVTFGFEAEKLSGGVYTEYPLSNGIFAEYDLNNENFFKARYGYAPEYYMEDLGNILELFDWWNSFYSSLLVELCTDMKGLELSFGTKNFLGKDIIANAGVTIYNLNYNSLANDTVNAVLGTDIPAGRDLSVEGKLIALHFNIAKNYKLNERWSLKPGVNLNYINSFYGVIYSELGLNDTISYKLNNWLRDYLEGLLLPTVMLELKYEF